MQQGVCSVLTKHSRGGNYDCCKESNMALRYMQFITVEDDLASFLMECMYFCFAMFGGLTGQSCSKQYSFKPKEIKDEGTIIVFIN